MAVTVTMNGIDFQDKEKEIVEGTLSTYWNPLVTTISNGFASQSNLVNINFGNVINIAPIAFLGCQNLNTIILNNYTVDMDHPMPCISYVTFSSRHVVSPFSVSTLSPTNSVYGFDYSNQHGIVYLTPSSLNNLILKDFCPPILETIGGRKTYSNAAFFKYNGNSNWSIYTTSVSIGTTTSSALSFYGKAETAWIYDVPNFTLTNPTFIDNVSNGKFSGLALIKNYTLLNLSSIPSNTFSYTHLETINCPQAQFVGDNAFANCSSLTQYNFSNILGIGSSAFRDCKKLTTINFPSLISLGNNAFDGCTSLINFNLPILTGSIKGFASTGISQLNTSIMCPNITTIDENAFERCGSLIEVQLHNNIKTIKKCAFSHCYTLKTVSGANVTLIEESAFFHCYSLSNIFFPKLSIIPSYCFAECGGNKQTYTLDFNNIISIGEYAFKECDISQEFILPKITSFPFSGVSNARELSLTFPNMSTITGSSSVNLEGLSVDHLNLSIPNVSMISNISFCNYELNMYAPKLSIINCNNDQRLRSLSLYLSATITGDIFIYTDYLQNFTLKNVNTLNFNIFHLTNFVYRSDTLKMYFPDTITIQEIYYPNDALSFLGLFSAPNLRNFPENFFSGCSYLETVYLPNLQEIPANAFNGCYALSSITMPRVSKIGSYALRDCSLSTTLSFDNVIEIGEWAFGGWSGTDITFKANQIVSLANSNAFSMCYALSSIYVPGNLVQTYKTTHPWSYYADKIKAIPTT